MREKAMLGKATSLPHALCEGVAAAASAPESRSKFQIYLSRFAATGATVWDTMRLFTSEIRAQLLRNGEMAARCADDGKQLAELVPVVKLFTPDAASTWLLSEIDPDDPDIAFGLCDLGMGCPELGSVRISELQSVRGKLGRRVERDLHFKPSHPIGVYARAAWSAGAITECPRALAQAACAEACEKRGAG
jgi:hypothetical protein